MAAAFSVYFPFLLFDGDSALRLVTRCWSQTQRLFVTLQKPQQTRGEEVCPSCLQFAHSSVHPSVRLSVHPSVQK